MGGADGGRRKRGAMSMGQAEPRLAHYHAEPRGKEALHQCAVRFATWTDGMHRGQGCTGCDLQPCCTEFFSQRRRGFPRKRRGNPKLSEIWTVEIQSYTYNPSLTLRCFGSSYKLRSVIIDQSCKTDTFSSSTVLSGTKTSLCRQCQAVAPEHSPPTTPTPII